MAKRDKPQEQPKDDWKDKPDEQFKIGQQDQPVGQQGETMPEASVTIGEDANADFVPFVNPQAAGILAANLAPRRDPTADAKAVADIGIENATPVPAGIQQKALRATINNMAGMAPPGHGMRAVVESGADPMPDATRSPAETQAEREALQASRAIEKGDALEAELAALNGEGDAMLGWKEAGQLVGRHPDTIKNWVRDGLLKLYRGPHDAPAVSKRQLLSLWKESSLNPKKNT